MHCRKAFFQNAAHAILNLPSTLKTLPLRYQTAHHKPFSLMLNLQILKACYFDFDMQSEAKIDN